MKKLLGITVLLAIAYGALLFSDKNARSFEAHFNLAKEIGLYGIVTLAAGLLIVTGGIDLSIGSLVCFTSTVFGLLVVKYKIGIVPAITVMVLTGGIVGVINGLFVTKLRLQPFMVTLCGLLILRSLARWLAGDTTVEGLSMALESWTTGFGTRALGVPIYLLALAVLAAAAAVFLHASVHGRYFLALGSNERAARFAGVAVDSYRILAYVMCSLLTTIYSFLALMNSPSVAPSSVGKDLELTAIAGAVLGGCALRGGEGTVYGMLVGAAIIQTLIKVTSFYRISSALESTMIGGILLAGVILDELLRRRDAVAQQARGN